MNSRRSLDAECGLSEACHPLETLRLSRRACNALRRRKVTTLEQLAQMSEREILAVDRIGGKTLREIVTALRVRAPAMGIRVRALKAHADKGRGAPLPTA